MACASLPEAGARAGARGRPPGLGGLRSGCPTPRGPRPARLSGPGAPRRNAAAASLGAAEPAPVGASPASGPPAAAPECRARQPRLPTWKIRGGRNRKAPGEAARASKEPRSPLLSNLIWGWGEAGNYKKKKKKQARDLFFSSISLVTGSPRIPCARRLGGGGRADFTPHEPSGETWRFSPNLRSKYAKAPDENHQLVRPQPGLGRRKCLQSGTRRLRGAEAHPRATCPLRSSQSLVGLPLRFFCLPPKDRVIFFFNPQKGRARLLQSCASGCPRGVSGLSSCGPGGPGSRRGLPRGWRGRRGRRCCRCGCGGGGDCAQRG